MPISFQPDDEDDEPWSMESIVEFLMSKLVGELKIASDVTPVNFVRFNSSDKCRVFGLFRPTQDTFGWSVFAPAAAAFVNEQGVEFGYSSCGDFEDFSFRLGFRGRALVTVNGRLFGGERAAELVAFVNERCGTERRPDGQLTAEAGRDARADALLQRALMGVDVGEELTVFPLYLKAWERVLAVGMEGIRGDAAKMEAVLSSREASPAVLDGVRRRLNVYRSLLERVGHGGPVGEGEDRGV
jgi:hypothetical protein